MGRTKDGRKGGWEEWRIGRTKDGRNGGWEDGGWEEGRM